MFVNVYNCPPATFACTAIPDSKIGPNDVDTDGDLLNDGVEVKWYDTSPSNFDTDGDGCSDGREAADVNGDHKAASTDSLSIGQHMTAGSLPPSPLYNTSGVRRTNSPSTTSTKMGNRLDRPAARRQADGELQVRNRWAEFDDDCERDEAVT